MVEAFGGGVFQSVRLLCEGVHSHAENVIVYSLAPETPADFQPLFPVGTRFIHFPMTKAVNMKADLLAAYRLRQLISQEKPAVVHAHSSKAGGVVRLGLWGLGIPLLYSPRGYSFLMQNTSLLKRAVYLVIERVLGFFPATTIACGFDEYGLARKVSCRTKVIPNAFDAAQVPTQQQMRPPYKAGQMLKVVSCGRISPQKNFGQFCNVARHFIGQNVEFTWIGGGDTDGFAVPANVNITGWVSHGEALQKMQAGHVFLHLSKWEGLSRVLLEAMAHGFPLVLSDAVGNRELLAYGNGFLCQTETAAMEALETLLAAPERLADMGKASHNLLMDRYDWTKNMAIWRETYGC